MNKLVELSTGDYELLLWSIRYSLALNIHSDGNDVPQGYENPCLVIIIIVNNQMKKRL